VPGGAGGVGCRVLRIELVLIQGSGEHTHAPLQMVGGGMERLKRDLGSPPCSAIDGVARTTSKGKCGTGWRMHICNTKTGSILARSRARSAEIDRLNSLPLTCWTYAVYSSIPVGNPTQWPLQGANWSAKTGAACVKPPVSSVQPTAYQLPLHCTSTAHCKMAKRAR